MAHGCAIFLAHRSHHDNALSCYTSCRNRKRDLQMLQAVITKPSSAPEQSNSDGDAECFEIAVLPHRKRESSDLFSGGGRISAQTSHDKRRNVPKDSRLST